MTRRYGILLREYDGQEVNLWVCDPDGIVLNASINLLIEYRNRNPKGSYAIVEIPEGSQ